MENNNNNVPVAPVAPAPVVAPVAPVATPAQPAPAPVVAAPAQPVVNVPSEPQQLAQQLSQVAPTPAIPNAFELPQGVSERTKENFDRLTDSNRKLLEANQILETELSRRSLSERQMAPISQQQPQQPDVTQFVEVDSITGEKYVNEQKLQQAIVQANDRASRAEQQVRSYIETQQQKEIRKQEDETYMAYPQLNPSNVQGYDKELEVMTRAYALDSMMNPKDYGNRTLSFKEAADMASKKLKGNIPVAAPSAPAQVAAVQQAVVNNQPNAIQQPISQGNSVNSGIPEQGGMAAEGRPVNVNPQDLTNDLRVLQDRTRKGDVWALAQRLTQVPHTGTPTHGDEAGV